jgi:hypothetical protein
MKINEIIQLADNLPPDNLTGDEAHVLSSGICGYVLAQNIEISQINDIKKRTEQTIDLVCLLNKIRNILVCKSDQYKQNLIDLYTNELSKIKGFTTIPKKYLDDIENHYKFVQLALTSIVDYQIQFVWSWSENNTSDLEELDNRFNTELALLKNKIQNYERKLYVKHNYISETKVKLHINSTQRAIDNKKLIGLDSVDYLQNTLKHYQLLEEEIKLTKEMNVQTSPPTATAQPEAPQRTINEKDIRVRFNQKLNNRKKEGTKVSEADIIISNLRIDRNHYIDYARIALIFYNSKFVTTENTFKEWLTKFYSLMGIENGTKYDQNKLNFSKELQSEFQYLL